MEIMVDEHIRVMEAYKRGAKIKFRKRGTTEWEFTDEPIWNFSCYEYAVDDTKVLDVTNIKQFFAEYKGDKVADANNVLDQILSVLTSASYDHIVQWLENNTQHIQSNGFIKQDDIDKDFLQENYSDLYEEIEGEIDVDCLDDDKLEEATRRWMNRADYSAIVEMIKSEA